MGCCGGDMSGISAWFRRLGIYGYILVGLTIAITAYLIFEHQVHLAQYSTIIIILVFVGLHLAMHVGGHGSHDGQKGGGCGWGWYEGYQVPGTGKDENGPQKTGRGSEEKEREGGRCH